LQENLMDGIPSLWQGNCVVFHLAARVTNIQANMKDHLGMLQDNLRINADVIEAMRLYPPKVAVLCSTVCVYPHDAPVPTPESAAFPFHPEDTNEGYGLGKCILEKQGEYLCKELHIPTVVTRFSNAIGLRDYYDTQSSHVVPALIRRIMKGEDPLMVWGSGRQTRVFVDARDLACALVDLAETEKAQDARPINIGHKYEIDIGSLALLIAKICGKNPSIVFDTSFPDGHARRAVDNSRLRSLIGWVPDRPLESTIREMVAEYKAGKAWL
jgi:GDP-L-fucose synthase